jgi:hypothetical protein
MVALTDANASLTPSEHTYQLRRAVVAATVGTPIPSPRSTGGVIDGQH